jgi:hypothetical protein
MNPSGNLSFMKITLDAWELNPKRMGLLWMKTSASWGRIILAEGPHYWGRRTVAFILQLRKNTGNVFYTRVGDGSNYGDGQSET